MQAEDDKILDVTTSLIGFITAAIADGQMILAVLGLVVGFGGLGVGLSREIRAWLDRRQES